MLKARIESFTNLLGLPRSLSFVLFTSLLGGAFALSNDLIRVALIFASNLALLSFAQAYKHIHQAPADVLDPDPKDPNPIAQGELSLYSTRFAALLMFLLTLIPAWKLGGGNLILVLMGLLVSVSLYNPSIYLSSRPMFGLNSNNWILGALMMANAMLTTQNHFMVFEKLIPVLFVLSFYFLYRSFELKYCKKTGHLSNLMQFLVAVFVVLTALLTLFSLRPFPLWVIALLAFLIAIRLALRNTELPKENSNSIYMIFNYFDSSAAIAFLVYFIITSIKFR